MNGDQKTGLHAFILNQVKQIQRLTVNIIHCWHDSYQLREKLKIMELRTIELQHRYDLLINNIDNVRATCPCEDQCPVGKLKLK